MVAVTGAQYDAIKTAPSPQNLLPAPPLRSGLVQCR